MLSPRALPASQREPSGRDHWCAVSTADHGLSHSSFSAPFHRAPRVQPLLGAYNGLRGDQATENARQPRHSRPNAPIDEYVVRAWGSPVDYGESPQKIGRWGAKRVELDETHDICFQFSTVYTYALQDLFHFDNKPFGGVSGAEKSRR